MDFKIAEKADTDCAWELVLKAREFLKSQGVDQWQGDYPNRRTIASDIAAGNRSLTRPLNKNGPDRKNTL